MNRFSDLNKTRRAESVKKIALDKVKQAPIIKHIGSPRSEYSIKNLVDEIIKYLIEIIQVLLQQQNSNNYLNIIETNEKMYKQLERKMSNMIGQKCYEIRCQFLQKMDDLQKINNNNKIKKQKQINNLKNQRKNITQNILAYQRSTSFNSFGHHRSHQIQKFNSENQLPHVLQCDQKIKQIGSIELNSIQSKISALEDNQNQKLRQTLQKIEKKFDQNCRDIKLMAQKHIDLKINFQQRLDTTLSSLWNVISQNQSKLCELQNILQRIK